MYYLCKLAENKLKIVLNTQTQLVCKTTLRKYMKINWACSTRKYPNSAHRAAVAVVYRNGESEELKS